MKTKKSFEANKNTGKHIQTAKCQKTSCQQMPADVNKYPPPPRTYHVLVFKRKRKRKSKGEGDGEESCISHETQERSEEE